MYIHKSDFQYWIDNLKLVEHPGDEDGFFREAFRDDSIQVNVSSPDGDNRSIASIAHFLQVKDKGGIYALILNIYIYIYIYI